MGSENIKVIGLFFILIFSISQGQAQQSLTKRDSVSLQNGIELLQKYFDEKNSWYSSSPDLKKDVSGLVHFIEDEPIDDVLSSIGTFTKDSSVQFVYRLPENVSDSLLVPGYVSNVEFERKSEKIGIHLQRDFQNREISLPANRMAKMSEEINLIAPEEGMQLFTDSIYSMPEEFDIPEVIPDSILDNAASFEKFMKLDSLRKDFVEQKRVAYNDSISKHYMDSVLVQYKQELFETEYKVQKKQLLDSVKLNNFSVLRAYNDSVMMAVNDSIFNVLNVLSQYADYIDTSSFRLTNIANDSFDIKLSNAYNYYSKIWLKNEQNDSLRILVKNLDKKTIQMRIDDGVTISRFKAKETKGFDFASLNKSSSDFTKVGDQYELYTPWTLTGDGNVGFTQAYFKDWKAGGTPYISMLSVLKGEADYKSKDEDIQWESSLESTNGWIRQGSETDKNSDKIEFISKFGYSAFKKWYYSFEMDIYTQLFKGYDDDELIANFQSPITSTYKLGMDYKPNDNFSLLLSPLTSKTVFVKDTANIDQTTYGIGENKQRLWKPGLNVDLAYTAKFKDNITYKTDYDMFINYRAPFSKFDVNWENTLTTKLTDLITMTFRLYIKYDDDVTFDTGRTDVDGNAIYATRWQIKELLTFGFTYNLDKKVKRTHRVR